MPTKYKTLYKRGAEHRHVFFHSNPEPPWVCTFCDFEIWEEGSVCVHHVDHNPRRNTLENLAPMHWGCHSRYHAQHKGPPE